MDENPTGLPDEFLKRLKELLPAELHDAVSETFLLPRRAAVRINPLRGDPTTIREGLIAAGVELTPVPWSEVSFSIPTAHREIASRSPASERGEVYLQSLSSQLAAVVLAPNPCDQVLDLAAAPGGKAAHLAALMQNQGLLSCVEPIRSRFFRLQANLKQQGITIARFYMTDGRTVGNKVGPRFDRALLDAPCSGEARFSTTDPRSFATWSLRKLKETSRKQIGLIKSAFQSLKPGGRLLYATCSFAPEENERVVASLLKKFPEQAGILPIDFPTRENLPGILAPNTEIPRLPGLKQFGEETFPDDLNKTVRIIPNHLYDGFYLALIEKKFGS